MFNHGPSDRLQIRQVGQLQSPAVCFLCGNPTHQRGYVDFDTFFEWEGQMYLCFTCVMQAAELIGCIVPDEAEHLKEVSKEIAAENAALKEKLTDATSRLDVFLAAFDTIDPAGVAALRGPVEVPEEPEGLTPEPTNGREGEQSESPEPSKSNVSNESARAKLSDDIPSFTL